jgi:hypothetical protein
VLTASIIRAILRDYTAQCPRRLSSWTCFLLQMETCCVPTQSIIFITLMMEAVCSSGTSASTYHTTKRFIPEDSNHHNVVLYRHFDNVWHINICLEIWVLKNKVCQKSFDIDSIGFSWIPVRIFPPHLIKMHKYCCPTYVSVSSVWSLFPQDFPIKILHAVIIPFISLESVCFQFRTRFSLIVTYPGDYYN